MELNDSEDSDYNLALEQSLSLDDSVECDFLGEQETVPRIGEDYQVEIPDVLEKSDYFNLEQGPEPDYFLGASVPVTSINDQEDRRLEHEETDDYLVPGSASDSWSEAEKASFLLGLYIFSRNFARLKQFLVCKRMEDILSFYYGEFYQSHDYRRWSESRKKRNRGVVGRKIFTGLRKQEFLSRILPSMSEDRKNATLQVFKEFEEVKISFEEFIFSIKDMIGMRTLVKAIGIGKGKQDLTTMTQEPSRTNQVNPVVRTTGKAFSSLTPDEIAKYLNGGCRLSKARSHDLFWEAVWPRLLARGWNSEGPKGRIIHNATGLKNNLVFLVPGVVKFSRRKLKKGEDYFDSVPGVLNKVASDLSLLELDNDDEEENETKSDDEDVDTEKRHCYLQPRATNSTTEGMKFTVVDTCSGDWKPYKVRELSGLSFDDYRKVNSRRYSEIIEEADDVDSGDTPVVDDDSDQVQVLRACRVLAKGNGKDERRRKVSDFDLRNVSPVIKRRRLTACNNAEPRDVVTSKPEVPVKSGRELASPTLVIVLFAAPGDPRPENRDRDSTVDDDITEEPLRCSSSTTQNVERDDMSISDVIPDSQEEAGRIRNSVDLNLPPESENEPPNGGDHEDETAKIPAAAVPAVQEAAVEEPVAVEEVAAAAVPAVQEAAVEEPAAAANAPNYTVEDILEKSRAIEQHLKQLEDRMIKIDQKVEAVMNMIVEMQEQRNKIPTQSTTEMITSIEHTDPNLRNLFNNFERKFKSDLSTLIKNTLINLERKIKSEFSTLHKKASTLQEISDMTLKVVKSFVDDANDAESLSSSRATAF